MAETVILHLHNEDPVMADVEALPGPADNWVKCSNLRKRDGKPVYYVSEGSVAYFFPIHRISFIEVMASLGTEREVIEFFRRS